MTEIFTPPTLSESTPSAYIPTNITVLQNVNRALVSIKADRGVFIALYPRKNTWTGGFYAIMIDGKKNTYTALRLVELGKTVAGAPGNFLEASHYTSMWLSWGKVEGARLIQLGTGSTFGQNVVLEYNHTEPFFVNYIAVGVWISGDGAYWKFTY